MVLFMLTFDSDDVFKTAVLISEICQKHNTLQYGIDKISGLRTLICLKYEESRLLDTKLEELQNELKVLKDAN